MRNFVVLNESIEQIGLFIVPPNFEIPRLIVDPDFSSVYLLNGLLSVLQRLGWASHDLKLSMGLPTVLANLFDVGVEA